MYISSPINVFKHNNDTVMGFVLEYTATRQINNLIPFTVHNSIPLNIHKKRRIQPSSWENLAPCGNLREARRRAVGWGSPAGQQITRCLGLIWTLVIMVAVNYSAALVSVKQLVTQGTLVILHILRAGAKRRRRTGRRTRRRRGRMRKWRGEGRDEGEGKGRGNEMKKRGRKGRWKS